MPQHPDTLPFQIEYYDPDHAPDYWHAQTRLFFVLSGSAQVVTGSRSFEVQSEDIFLQNPGESQLISGTAWEMLSITFRQDLLPFTADVQIARFDVNSSGSTFAPRYDYIRYCMAHLAELYNNKEGLYSALSIFFALYSHLQTNFTADLAGSGVTEDQNQDRLLSMINYINSHYKENLTLSDTASVFGLSAPYFSAFFKKQSGKTFIEYYNEIRLSHGVQALLHSSDSIETIALDNGFSDSRSFTSLFKKQYGTLPNIYRKSHSHTASPMIAAGEDPEKDPASDRFLPLTDSHSQVLAKYLTVFQEEQDFLSDLRDNPRIIDAGTISFLAEGQPLSHNYRNMICVGSAKQFLYKEVQDMLIRAQREIRFRYVKFHGLLSDDMMVYTEDSDGTPHYSFTFVDKALDFLQSIGLRPLCQLSFMPIALAEDPSRLVDFYHYNTSPPKDLQKWADLVDATVRHFVDRYGLEEVKTWLFCVWNEPDETVDQFAWEDKYRFFEFYDKTWQTVKAVCPDLRFGTPSMLLSVQKEAGWAGDFFWYTREHLCYPDFINIHYYDNSLFEEDTSDRVRGEKGYSAENMEHSFPLSADPHAFMKFINNIKALMRKHNMRNLPIYLTEWNLTISHRDLINDTCFKSCHLVKNLLENYDRLESFSYWSLTDFIEELQIPTDLYHGGLGLFTFNGIPKANYNAFLLLGKLGDELLAKGDGYFITRTRDSIRILLYNYEHYSRLFAAGMRSELTASDRYSPFEEMSTAQFAVRLSDLPGKEAFIKEFFVNQYAGSSYDTWVKMGGRALRSREEEDLLLQESRPGLSMHREPVTDGTLTLHVRMAPLEVRLLQIDLS